MLSQDKILCISCYLFLQMKCINYSQNEITCINYQFHCFLYTSFKLVATAHADYISCQSALTQQSGEVFSKFFLADMYSISITELMCTAISTTESMCIAASYSSLGKPFLNSSQQTHIADMYSSSITELLHTTIFTTKPTHQQTRTTTISMSMYSSSSCRATLSQSELRDLQISPDDLV